MPPEWEDNFWHENNSNSPFEGKNNKGMPTLRPPLYNAEDYTAAFKQLFSSSSSISALIDHSGGFSGSSSPDSSGSGPPEMSLRKFLNGSELLFKLEADLRHAFPTFVQDFVTGPSDGICFILEALKVIQTALDDCTGLREQRKLILDEQKCLQCLKLCLRNVEAVSKLASYPGGLYPLVAATISTVTATRIMAFEILACVCTEGGAEGHYKVSEGISTLRLRMGEPIRCKLLVGALGSAPPGTFQAKGIRFLTSWVASAPSPKHKVYIQCELEEAGFNPQAIRKGADLGGARESREVQSELDEWDRVSIDVDTLTRQNCQLRNSVATLQQELATLKDRLKRMDIPQKQEYSVAQAKRVTRPKRSEELVTTPADSEEEAEQIHQILEDLNNIVNSEMNGGNEVVRKKEKEIVPVHLVKSPPKRSPGSSTPANMNNQMSRPWPGSSASDDDDSDILDFPSDANPDRQSSPGKSKANVRRVVEQLEKSASGPSPKMFQKNSKYLLSKNISQPNVHSETAMLAGEPKPDYTLPNFHKQNHMASKFANFKSSKLYSSSPDNSSKNYSNSYAEVYEKSMSNNSNRYSFINRFSPNLDLPKKSSNNTGLRRSESLHASLASIEMERAPENIRSSKYGVRMDNPSPNYKLRTSNPSVYSWKSMENLDNENDENFTLRWRYPHPQFQQPSPPHKSFTPSPKSSKDKSKKIASAKMASKNGHMTGDLHLVADYRQNRFTKNSKGNNSPNYNQQNNLHSGNGSGVSLFRYAKKADKPILHLHPQQQHQIPANNHNEYQSEKENMKMFSLPPMLITSNSDGGNHRICDLPSGLY
ncbi:unnamed protein product [Allacma fusca]|uniref:GBD/FH3 domain-containing protein n=1 Tax=Allacma fusca TaxID=39272 RepID=A0A8J2NFU1_9HEXA|nr:unnamed protein product [Allacma fusca]